MIITQFQAIQRAHHGHTTSKQRKIDVARTLIERSYGHDVPIIKSVAIEHNHELKQQENVGTTVELR